jgi:urease accessory protein
MFAVVSTRPYVEPGTPSRASAPGTGALRISRTPRGSVVSRAFAASPLRLLTPRNHGRAAWIYTSTFGGGLLDGDAVRLRVEVEPGASAFVSSQASTKVYRAVDGCASAALDAAIGDGALLVVAADPIVCFARSRYAQLQRVTIEGGGGLVLVDWFTSGRHAIGERWAFDEYCSRTAVHRDGGLVWYDAVRLDRAHGPISPRMGRYDVLAAVVIIGPHLEASVPHAISAAADAPAGGDVVAAGSPLAAGGCVVRMAGRSVEEVGGVIRRCLSFVPDLLGDDPWARRW